MKNQLKKKTENLSDWYVDVIQKAKLADYSPVKGCMVIRPNGYGIWENVHSSLDPMLKKLGIENAYFPLFIPISFLHKEEHHVEGFSPELAIVTHGGGEKLTEELAVRPTSETIMYDMYSKWVSSYRDLPILLNQWNNAVRWEKRTYFFLRTTEFLWQEAHTAHATHEESLKMVYNALEAYRELAEHYLAIPVFKGRKSEQEKFAGAVMTTTIEAMMPDGKALQAGTSHDLGQNFSKKEAFDIHFADETGNTSYAWQTSFGLSTRVIGALIMTHGDDDGIVLPPYIAPKQVIIVPTEFSEEILAKCNQLETQLKKENVRVVTDLDQTHTLGYRLNEIELQGIPLIIVMGKREIESGNVTVKTRYNKETLQVDKEAAANKITELIDTIQQEMYKKALNSRENLISEINDYTEFKSVMQTKRGFIKAFWCENTKCEDEIKEETKATVRCLPFLDNDGNVLTEEGKCIKCGGNAAHKWLFAQAY